MRLNALLVLSLPVALVFALACGGGEEPTATAVQQAQPTAPAQPTATQVVIPTVAPLVPTATAEPAKPTAVPTATPTAAPAGPSGTLNVAVPLITPANFLASKIPWPGNLNIVAFGVGEGLVQTDYAEPPLIGQLNKNGIATNWVVATDLSKITFTIRKGVKFHKGYGELTAADVAFSFNDAIKPGSTWARVEMGDFLAEAVAVDGQTLDYKFKKWNSSWYGWMYPVTGAAPMVSKKANDELGYDKAVLTPVFTGPFEVVDWKANDKVDLKAVAPHWRATPRVEKVKVVEIPEVSSRLAAFKTGEVLITQLPNKFLRDAIQTTKGRIQMVGQPAGKHVAFAGNYWIKKHHDTGENIFPRPGFKPDAQHPWIGDPDNPDRMESARLVRQGMAMAIDRDLINKETQDGFAAASHSWYGFVPQMKEFKKEWIIPYDPAQAKQLIAKAGYPNGFKVPFYLPPDVPAVVSVEVGEAIALMWKAIGLDVTIENAAYQARRPSMVNRSIDVVWMWQHDGVGQVDTAQSQGTIPSAGWNRGMEIPWVLELWQQNDKENDPQKRVANNIKGEDLSREWMVVAPVVDISNLWVVNQLVKEWRPYTETAGYAGTFESVLLGK